MKKIIRIATRKSPLALWQASYVKELLLKIDPDLDVSFVGLTTEGDKEQTKSLIDIGGKSLFVKELQQALIHNQADIAVHSIKDMSVQPCPSLCLAAICERDDPRDVLVSAHYSNLNALPQGAVVGTASPRRTALLKSRRPDLQIKVLRGNVGTRLNKCESGDYDAAVFAAAGLKRLNLLDLITEYFNPEIFIPAIAQGAIGVECREKDIELQNLLHAINHSETALCVQAERAVNYVLRGDCYTPMGVYATITNDQMSIQSMVASLDGKTIIRSTLAGEPKNAIKLGEALAQQLLEKGAGMLLKTVGDL